MPKESKEKKASVPTGKETSLTSYVTSQPKPLTSLSKITSKVYSVTRKIKMVTENGFSEISHQVVWPVLLVFSSSTRSITLEQDLLMITNQPS